MADKADDAVAADRPMPDERCVHHAVSSPAGDIEKRDPDPVCGMTVDPQATPHRFEHNGQPQFFCSAGCRSTFIAEPARYLQPDASSVGEPAPAGSEYTCPMHAQVRQIGPGACPLCGMALEPAILTAATPPNAELADFTRRFWIGLALTLTVFVLEIGGHMFAIDHLIAPQLSNWVQLLLATPVVLWSG